MNYLAHLLLSENDKDVIFGNFIGDAIKGKDYEKYAPSVQKGILLHRNIDTYTDSHPIYLQSKRRFYEGFPKIGGVITDILYDHFLCIEWEKHTNQQLDTFIASSYQYLDTRQHEMPEKMKPLYDHMRTHDWLTRYKSKEGTALSLQQIGRRIGFGDQTDKAFDEFELNRAAFLTEFNSFFESISQYTSTILKA
jgi:acyl carrier protein phosphodiesterase